jgi:hypothetical protein
MLIHSLYPEMNTFLDVGCNSGAISAELLKLNKNLQVTGMDLSATLVDGELLKNPRFTFKELHLTPSTSIPDVDVIHYSAVHHHIVHKQGLINAIHIMGNLVSRCENLVFETGMIAEGSGFEWQQSLKNYFFSDEEHIHFLLSHLAERLSDFKVVDKFRIHLTSRPIIALKTNALTDSKPSPNSPQNFTAEKFIGRSAKINRLHQDDRYMYYNIEKDVFSKTRTSFHFLAEIEHKIGSQISHEQAVRPSIYGDGALYFKFKEHDFLNLGVIQNTSNQIKITWAHQINSWIEHLQTQTIQLEETPFPIFGTAIFAIDLIELSNRNIIIDSLSQKLLFIDFEPFASNNRWRNYFWTAHLMWQLGHLTYAIKYFLQFSQSYIALCFKRPSFQQRVLDKRPSLITISATITRSLMTKVWAKVNAK